MTREHYLLVGVQVRVVGEHVGRRAHPARFQFHLLSQLPVVQHAAAQPGDGRVPASPTRLARTTHLGARAGLRPPDTRAAASPV